MSNDKDTNIVYALNSYLWRVLKANLGWKESDYDNRVPIIPWQQQPEFLATGKPFVVYNSSPKKSFSPPVQEEAVMYACYGVKPSDAYSVRNLIIDSLADEYNSSDNVNWWIDNEPRDPKRKVSMTNGSVSLTHDAEPSDEEGGYTSSLIVLDISYLKNTASLKLRNF